MGSGTYLYDLGDRLHVETLNTPLSAEDFRAEYLSEGAFGHAGCRNPPRLVARGFPAPASRNPRPTTGF